MNRSIVIVLLLSLFTVIAGCTTSTQSSPRTPSSNAIDDYVTLGLNYLNNGQRDQARSNIQRALDIDSRSASANHAMALVNQAEGEVAAADDRFRKSISYDSSFTQGRYNYANFLWVQERWSDARDQYAEVVKDLGYRLRPESFVGLGRAELKLGRSAEAYQAFNDAVRLNPQLGIVWVELAEVEYLAGNYEQAASMLDEMAGLTSSTARSLWLGVRIHRELGNLNREASYGLALKNLFAGSPEAQAYLESLN